MARDKPDLKLVPNQAYTLSFPFGPEPVWSGASKQGGGMRYCWTVQYNGVDHAWFASDTMKAYVDSAPLHGGELTLSVTHLVDASNNHSWKVFHLAEDGQTWNELSDPGPAGQAQGYPGVAPAPQQEAFPPPPAHVAPPPTQAPPQGPAAPQTQQAPSPVASAPPPEARPKVQLGKQELADLFSEALVLAAGAWGKANMACLSDPTDATSVDVLYNSAFTLWKEFVQRRFTPNPLGPCPPQQGGGDGSRGPNPAGLAQPAVLAGPGRGPGAGPGDGPPPPVEPLSQNQVTFRKQCEALKQQILNACGNDVPYYTVLEEFGWKNAAQFDGEDTRTADACLVALTKALGALATSSGPI